MRRIVGVVVSALVVLGVLSRARKEEQPAESKEGFACALHALSGEERRRHVALSAQLLAAIRGQTEIADGYVFTIDESAMDWTSLAEWARAERLCCPFFRVGLRAQPHGKSLELELAGAPGVKRFILEELPVVTGRRGETRPDLALASRISAPQSGFQSERSGLPWGVCHTEWNARGGGGAFAGSRTIPECLAKAECQTRRGALLRWWISSSVISRRDNLPRDEAGGQVCQAQAGRLADLSRSSRAVELLPDMA